jgi:hypothetical protein
MRAVRYPKAASCRPFVFFGKAVSLPPNALRYFNYTPNELCFQYLR